MFTAKQKYFSTSQLLRSLLHDLSSPISALLYSQHLINDSKLDTGTKELLLLNKNAINQIKNITSSCENCFFNISVSHQQFSPKKVCKNVLDVFQQLDLDTYNIEYNLDISSTIMIEGDELMFERVILNIVKNAIEAVKAIPKDRLIRINGEVIKNKLSLKIIDNGLGISSKQITKLFKENNLPKAHDYKRGWGLPCIKRIVMGYFKGEIDIKSKKNKFTEIKILLGKVVQK